MDGILGRVMAGVPLLPGHAVPLNAADLFNLEIQQPVWI